MAEDGLKPTTLSPTELNDRALLMPEGNILHVLISIKLKTKLLSQVAITSTRLLYPTPTRQILL